MIFLLILQTTVEKGYGRSKMYYMGKPVLSGYQNMIKILETLVISLVLTNQAFAAGQMDVGTLKSLGEEAEIKLREFLPKLYSIGNKHPNDTEIQLGLGVIYSRYGLEGISQKIEEQWQKVLRIDPNNKTAWAISVTKFCRMKTARKTNLLEWIERGIDNAKKRGVNEMIVRRSGNPLYPIFKEEETETIVISDFDAARKQLCEKLDEELSLAIAEINQGEKRDPDNALYNYLKAHVHFELGQKEVALKEIGNAVRKKYLKTYFTETRSATAKVLQEVGFPNYLRAHIEDVYSPFGDFLRNKIWKKQMAPLSETYAKQGDVQHALDISVLVLGIAKQIREEPLPYPSFFNQSFSQGLQKWAQERNKELSQKITKPEKKTLLQTISIGARYALFAGLCGILVVGLILVRKKRAIKEGNSKSRIS